MTFAIFILLGNVPCWREVLKIKNKVSLVSSQVFRTMFELMAPIPPVLLRFQDLKSGSLMESVIDIKYWDWWNIFSKGKKELRLSEICSDEYNDFLLIFSTLGKVLFFFLNFTGYFFHYLPWSLGISLTFRWRFYVKIIFAFFINWLNRFLWSL